jgi:hypothetical protein
VIVTKLRLSIIGLLAVLVPSSLVMGQRIQQAAPPPPVSSSQNAPFSTKPESPDESQARALRAMAKKANHMRQLQIMHDTDLMVKLSAELKEAVDKSNENTLSLDVIRRSDEIEKLAHNIKERMKESY